MLLVLLVLLLLLPLFAYREPKWTARMRWRSSRGICKTSLDAAAAAAAAAGCMTCIIRSKKLAVRVRPGEGTRRAHRHVDALALR